MTSRAVFVSAQLCFIIQVAFIPSALGSDGQSYGSSSPILDQMVLKRSIQSQGLLKSGSVPVLYNLTLQESTFGIAAKWSLKDPTSFPGLKFRVTTAGVNKTVSQNFYNISGLACRTSYLVKVSPVDAAGADYGVSMNATIMTRGVPQLFNLILATANNQIAAKWSLKDPKCFPDVRFFVSSVQENAIVLQNSYNFSVNRCNTTYIVKVSLVGLDLKPYGDPINASILVNGGPEVGYLVLSSTLNGIRANWAVKNAKCFRNSWFRVTTAGVDKILSTQHSYDISGLACNTNYNVQVSGVKPNGTSSYGVSAKATIMTKGVPEVIDLILKATNNEVSAKWAVKDPKCFPNVLFRVTFAGKSKMVRMNEIVFVGLPCDTSYDVKVSPTNGTGADYGLSKQATIITLGVQVTLRAMVAESLIAKWAPVVTSCRTFPSYEVTVSLPNGASTKKILTPKTHFVFAGLQSSTEYRVQVQPLDARGRVIGQAVAAQATTLHKDTAAGRCPYPTLAIVVSTSVMLCARVEKPSPSTNFLANTQCYAKYPPTAENNYIAVMYLVAPGWATFGFFQEYMRMFDYTGKFLVNGYYKNGAWVWGFGTTHDGTFPIDPALVSGLPMGGDGPKDFKMLYTDSANDYALRAAADGFPFDGMICAFPVKI